MSMIKRQYDNLVQMGLLNHFEQGDEDYQYEEWCEEWYRDELVNSINSTADLILKYDLRNKETRSIETILKDLQKIYESIKCS